jgi:hypothetical protein
MGKAAWAALSLVVGGFLGLIVGLFLGIGLGGGADTAERPRTVTETETRTEYVTVVEEASSGSSSSSSASQSAGDEFSADKECSVGQECDLGQSSVTVTSAERTQQINIDFSSSAYAGEYVVVEYDYTYGGSSPVTVDEPVWAIQDAEGTQYSLNFDITLSYEIDREREIIGVEVQPGVPTSGAAVFEIAPDAEGLDLFIVDVSNPQQSDVAQIPVG